MPLNYAKWDQLELSDDSDIEGHPNVDKRSLIRWKQRDIHEKREQRKHKIAALEVEIDSNHVLLEKLHSIAQSLAAASSPTTTFSSLVQSLKENPSPDAPPVNHLGQAPSITYDAMILSLLLQISEAAKKSTNATDDATLSPLLISGLNEHIKKLSDTQVTLRRDLEAEEKERAKRITVEDIHDGFDSKYVAPPPAPGPITPIPSAKQPKQANSSTTFETLNPKPSSASASTSSSTPTAAEDADEEEDESLPELTPSLTAFSQIPLRSYLESWEFIQAHRDVVVPGASDALLVAAFRAQGANKPVYAKQCVHQSLLLQYCDKLGGDGVRVFFKKMIAGDKRAETVFLDDVEKTYAHLASRVAATANPGEQIQLVAENPGQTISFNVPDGPPPAELVLEGPGTEGLDIEEVRRALQLRWDVFQGFSPEMREALRSGSLDHVNQVLGAMPVDEAEQLVRQLDIAGILNFADGGVRDETGKGKAVQEDDEEEEIVEGGKKDDADAEKK